MNALFGRLRGVVVGGAAAGAAMALFAAQPAFAVDLEPSAQDVSVVVHNARIVSIHRGRAAIDYVRRFDRVSADSYDWAPTGYRDVVRVVVEVTDPRASRVDADERPQRLTIELDPSRLSSEQNAALNNRRISQRVAAFQLNVAVSSMVERRISRAQSYYCSGDEFRCEDRIVYEEVPVERTRYTVI